MRNLITALEITAIALTLGCAERIAEMKSDFNHSNYAENCKTYVSEAVARNPQTLSVLPNITYGEGAKNCMVYLGDWKGNEVGKTSTTTASPKAEAVQPAAIPETTSEETQ